MLRRALQIGLVVYLAMGLGGLVRVASDAFEIVADVHADCCSDCDDPGCPEQDGQECPPQCDDCVCPYWVAPIVVAASSVFVSPSPQDVLYITGEVTYEPPALRGVFRPPRLFA